MSIKTNNSSVSVIIPCYNREEYIEETINSVLNQTYPHVNLICIDDGSTDGTRKILDRYADRMMLLQHEGNINKGQSAAINLGLQHATGSYIAILDSDDLFAPEKIECQVKYLEAHPEIGLVYANGYGIDENGQKLYEFYRKDHIETSDPERVLMDCYFLVPNNSLLRKSVFDLTGEFDESLRSAQDHDMAIRISEVTKIAYLDEHLFCYRRHQNSISARKADLRWKNGFLILKKATERYSYSLKAKRKRLAVLHFRMGQCYLEKMNILKMLGHFGLAGVLDPFRAIRVMLGKEETSGLH